MREPRFPEARMPLVTFTATLRRHLDAPPIEVPGGTVREALEAAFRGNPRLRGYVLDDQGRLRKHVAVFVDGALVIDRDGLADPVRPGSGIHVMQALSGG
ncbi:MoaD/ThiS family protein [Anaeromyxobacter sp. K]|uniref:MoaD/ThiS family protein n=1 Tax=Anaeromyxobacter sp. (strain K) TaxID=447217 RepID=UPI001E645320|nr:MoaD/ThiS family protein [Anaeromyxobacter sp. K]